MAILIEAVQMPPKWSKPGPIPRLIIEVYPNGDVFAKEVWAGGKYKSGKLAKGVEIETRTEIREVRSSGKI